MTKTFRCLELGTGVWACPRPIFSSAAPCFGCNRNETFTIEDDDMASMVNIIRRYQDKTDRLEKELKEARDIAHTHTAIKTDSEVLMCRRCNQQWPCELVRWSDPYLPETPRCHSGMDGDCYWWLCPQLQHYRREGCPLYDWDDEDQR